MTEVKFPSMVDMPDKEYFAHPAIDQSALKNLMKSPRDFAYFQTHEREVTDSLIFGKCAHSLVLGSGPLVSIKPDMRTNAGKAAYQQMLEEHDADDIEFVSKKDRQRLDDMLENAPDMKAMYGGKPEIAMFAIDPTTGLQLKGKADWLPEGPDDDGTYWIVDYKTTGMSTEKLFNRKAVARDVQNFGYHIQAAFYMRLYRLITGTHRPLRFVFWFQQTKPPYNTKRWFLDELQPEITEIANKKIDLALGDLKWWKEHGWLDGMLGSNYAPEPEQIQFDDWQLLDEEERIDKWQN